MTGNLKIISDSRIRYIVSKGPNYRFPSCIDFKKCREEIASALNDFGNRKNFTVKSFEKGFRFYFKTI